MVRFKEGSEKHETLRMCGEKGREDKRSALRVVSFQCVLVPNELKLRKATA